MTSRWKKICRAFGVVLILGSAAHTLGVAHLYFTKGLPDANRILLDIWIAEAQLAGGFLFLKGARETMPTPWLVGGSLLVSTYALPFLPVLVRRAPPIFWVAPAAYLIFSGLVLRAARAPRG